MIRFFFSFLYLGFVLTSPAQETSPLSLETIPLREDMKLVVTGAATIDGPRAAFTTSRGEIWILNQPLANSQQYSDFQWQKFASGLRKPTDLRMLEIGKLVVRQSVEATQLTDRNSDGIADEFLAVDASEIPEAVTPSPFKGIVWLDTPESTGPFTGQYFGGSQSGSYLSRLSIKKNESGTHSTLFVLQKGLTYPVDAIVRLEDNSWLIAQSNRSDPGRSRTKFALQRAVWNETHPFEVKSIRATENGFHLSFTEKLLVEAAGADWAYRIEAMSDQRELPILSVTVGDDEQCVTLECEPPALGIIYHISCDGVWSSERNPVRNPAGLFTFQKQ